MSNLHRWCWIPLLLLAFLAAATPAVLQAKPVPAPAPAPQAEPQFSIERATEGSTSEAPYRSWRQYEQSHSENLALCAATGFAGGFTVFLCISGWGLFRVAMPKNLAVGALLSATAASFAGFAMGFTGFLQIVGS